MRNDSFHYWTDDDASSLSWYHTRLFLYVLGIVFGPPCITFAYWLVLWLGVNRPVLGSPKAHPQAKYHFPVARCCNACAAVAVRRAEAVALRVRVRVSLVPFACGWILALGGCGPTTMRIGDASLPAEAGPASSYLFLVPIGLFLIALSLRPTDDVAVRIACVVTMGLLLILSIFLYALAYGLVERNPSLWWLAVLCYLAIALCVVIGAMLVPTVRQLTVHSSSGAAIPQMPSRRAALRLWFSLRVLGFFMGAALGIVPYVSYTAADQVWKLGPSGRFELSHVAGYAAAGFFFLLFSATFTPARRGVMLRFLASRPGATEDRAAACIAELLAPLRESLRVGPRSFVMHAASRFRAIPLELITLDDLSVSSSIGSASRLTRLASKSQPARFGQVDAWCARTD